MREREKLKKLLEEKLIPDLEAFLSKLDMIEHSGCLTEEDTAVYAETADLSSTFKSLLADIASGAVDDTDAHEILKELKKYGV